MARKGRAAGIVGAVIVGAVVIVGGTFFLKCVERIKPGYVGVVYGPKGVQSEPLREGWHLVMPWDKVTEYNTSIEQAYLSADHKEGSEGNDAFNVPTKDGKQIEVDMEYSYSFDADKAPEIYRDFRGKSTEEINRTFIRGKMKSWAAEVTSKYTVSDIYGDKRNQVNTELFNHVKKKFVDNNIIIESANFSRIDVDKQTAKVIQTKVNTRESVETEKLKLERAEAEKKRIQVEAEAKAEANKKLEESLTPELIEMKKLENQREAIEAWKAGGSKVPTVMGAGGNILDLTKMPNPNK